MSALEWRAVERDARRVEAVEDGETVVGTITFDQQRHEWLAEADGQSLACTSFADAAAFVETVREPVIAVEVVRAPA